MQINSKANRKILYLPIEVKQREFDAQVLLAARAAKRGYQVFIGTHASIYQLIRNNKIPSGLILDKSLPDPKNIEMLYEKCQLIWVMDAEISPILTEETIKQELPSRLFSAGIRKIDKFLMVGNVSYETATNIFADQKSKVIKSGWPRLDLTGKFGLSFYHSETEKIKSKYSNYFLFASSFGGNKDPKKVYKQRKGKNFKPSEFWSDKAIQQRYEKFITAVNILKKWDNDPNVPTIIVRPHVNESVKIWKKALGKLNKTFVESDGNATAWIYASSGVIHQGSTIALQSFLCDKPIFFLKEAAIKNYSINAEKISNLIVSTKNPPRFLDHLESLKSSSSYKIVNEHVHSPTNGSAEYILDQIDLSLNQSNGVISKFKLLKSQICLNSLRRALGLIRDEIQWRLGLINIYPQSVAINNGLRKKDIIKILNVLPNSSSFNVRWKTINLWEITSK